MSDRNDALLDASLDKWVGGQSYNLNYISDWNKWPLVRMVKKQAFAECI